MVRVGVRPRARVRVRVRMSGRVEAWVEQGEQACAHEARAAAAAPAVHVDRLPALLVVR